MVDHYDTCALGVAKVSYLLSGILIICYEGAKESRIGMLHHPLHWDGRRAAVQL